MFVKIHDGKIFVLFVAEQQDNKVHPVVLKNWCLLDKLNSSRNICNNVYYEKPRMYGIKEQPEK